MKCCSLRVRVDTEKKEKRFVWWLSIFFFPMHWSGFQNRKNFPVCIYKHMHILSQSFLLALKSRAKLFRPIHIFGSNTKLLFLLMLCFCFLFRDLLLLLCLYNCSELTSVLQQGKADRAVSVLLCGSGLQESCEPWPCYGPTWAQF